MGENLQALLDRMSISGSCGKDDGMNDLANSLAQKLDVADFGPTEYLQLAEMMIRLKIRKEQQEQSLDENFSTYRDAQQYEDDDEEGDKELDDDECKISDKGSPSAASPTAFISPGVSSTNTWSTHEESVTMEPKEDAVLSPLRQQHRHTPSRSRAHQDMDDPSAAQPECSHSPNPLTRASQHSPSRRPRPPSSRSNSQQRNVRSSPPSADQTATKTESLFEFYPFSRTDSSAGQATENTAEAFPDSASFGAPRSEERNVFIEKPEAAADNTNPARGSTFVFDPPMISTPPIAATSPRIIPTRGSTFVFDPPMISSPPVAATSPRKNTSPPQPNAIPPSSPAMSRPGLQEEDINGISESPRWAAPSPRPSPKRDEGQQPQAVTRFATGDDWPGGDEMRSAPTPGGVETAKTPMADSTPGATESVNDPMSTTPMMGDMFTPPPATSRAPFGAGATFASSVASNEEFKTGKNKNRRKDGTPFVNLTVCSPVTKIEQSQQFGSANDQGGVFFPNAATLEQPSLSHNSGATESQQLHNGFFPSSTFGTTSGLAEFNMGADTGSRRNHRRNVRRPGMGTPQTKVNQHAIVHPGPTSEPDSMEVDPLSPKYTQQQQPQQPQPADDSPKISFSIGVGGGSNHRATKARSHHRRAGSPSRTLPLGSHIWSVPPQSQLPPIRREEPDYSEIKSTINAIKEEARTCYFGNEYRESIRHYTRAISLLSENPAKQQLSDMRAVLYSNRAAALMMIGAFQASQEDCERGIPLVSEPGENAENFSSDSGPPLKIKLLTRLGRVMLKRGDHEAAARNFREATGVANAAVELSSRIHNAEAHQKHKALLESMMTEASLGLSDSDRLRLATENVKLALKYIDGDTTGRRAHSDALAHVSAAMASAPGSVYFMEVHISVLVRMKRWREVAGFCERVAALNSRMGGIFERDLTNSTPFLSSTAPLHFSPDFFGESRDETPETMDLKLKPKAAAEAVFWIPNAVIPHYLRALRLEERYPASELCISALLDFVKNGSSTLRESFAWLDAERKRLERTKLGREKGDVLFKKGEFGLAAAHYAHCLKIDLECTHDQFDGANAGGRLHAVLHCNRAACLMSLKRHEEALEECTAAIRIHSRYMKAILRRARCYARLNRYQEAESEYKQWLNLVEEARRMPADSRDFITPCLFDGPRDVDPDNIRDVTAELETMQTSRRKAESAAREESARRQERQQRWQSANNFSSSSSWGDFDTAQQRRDQWQNHQHGARRWDSFKDQGPRSRSSGHRARASSWREPERSNSSNRHRSADPIPPGDPTDHYNALGVNIYATDEEIKKAYRALARKVHPDKNPSADAQEKFQAIQHAYEVLSDPSKRLTYNRERGYHRRF